MLSSPQLRDIPLETERQLQSRKGSRDGRSCGWWVVVGGVKLSTAGSSEVSGSIGDSGMAHLTPVEVHRETFWPHQSQDRQDW